KITMKLILTFSPPKEKMIPFDHNYMVGSSLYRLLATQSPEYAEGLHKKTNHKGYVISNLLPSGKRIYDQGIGAERYVLIVASRDNNLLAALQVAIQKQGHLNVNNSLLPLIQATIVNINIPPPPCELLTKSPVLIKKDDRFIRPDDAGFNEAVLDWIKRKYVHYYQKPCPEIRLFNIVNYENKLKVVKLNKLACTVMRFFIDAPEDVIEMLLTEGLGSKTALGFGFVDEVR
ncbi:MAG: CRISPR-associated endoribonuclease Cas6, partial [Euryarchaeota archaeon]|nr:CRISPR-associated endoribonuclease Cas6 [Euryarchaeota archaeon]